MQELWVDKSAWQQQKQWDSLLNTRSSLWGLGLQADTLPSSMIGTIADQPLVRLSSRQMLVLWSRKTSKWVACWCHGHSTCEEWICWTKLLVLVQASCGSKSWRTWTQGGVFGCANMIPKPDIPCLWCMPASFPGFWYPSFSFQTPLLCPNHLSNS